MPKGNNTYSNELKLEVVQAYLEIEESMQIAGKHEIRNVLQMKVWVRKFKEVEYI